MIWPVRVSGPSDKERQNRYSVQLSLKTVFHATSVSSILDLGMTNFAVPSCSVRNRVNSLSRT